MGVCMPHGGRKCPRRPGGPAAGLLHIAALAALVAPMLLLPGAAAAADADALHARRSLLFFPLGERTHIMVHLEVAAELAARGHAVTLLLPECHRAFAEARAAERRPDAAAALRYETYPLDCEWVENDKRRASGAGQLQSVWMIIEALANRTDWLLSDQETMARLEGMKGSIDLVVADNVGFGPLLPMKLGLPFIDFDVGTAGSLYEPLFYGAQSAPAYVPAVGTFFPTNGMGVLQKTANVFATLASQLVLSAVYRHPSMWVQRLLRKHGITMNWPYVKPILELVNSNWALEAPRPAGPMTKYAGPVLPTPAAPLPADLDAWVSGAGSLGTVLVSFGGTLAAPAAASLAVLRAAAAVPEARFVWKLSEAEQAALAEDLKSAPPNLLIRSWVPQNDLLGHPGVNAFVTQGGFLSIAEAAYHGVPIVGVPLIAGQGELIRFAADQGRGVMLQKSVLTSGDAPRLASAIRQVLSHPSYASSARLASERLRAARVPYRAQAADWVEYAAALRTHGSFLHTQGQLMPWYEVACLDVAVVLAAAALLPALLALQAVAARRGGPSAARRRMMAAAAAAGKGGATTGGGGGIAAAVYGLLRPGLKTLCPGQRAAAAAGKPADRSACPFAGLMGLGASGQQQQQQQQAASGGTMCPGQRAAAAAGQVANRSACPFAGLVGALGMGGQASCPVSGKAAAEGKDA